MSRAPREIETLIWAIADDPSPEAIDGFRLRYPAYESELNRRIEMIDSLKSSGRATPKPRPTFQVRERRSAWSPLTIGLASVAALTLIGTLVVLRRPPADLPADARPRPTSTLSWDPTVAQTAPAPVVPPPTVAKGDPAVPPAISTPAYLKPSDLRVESARLRDALEMIAALGQVRLEIAPGLVDPIVRLDFRQTTPIGMIQSLGRDYGFTAFDEGNSVVLIVPVTESGSQVPDVLQRQ